MEIRVVLHLFEVADRDSPGVREDVGNHRYALFEEDGIGFGSGGSVRELENEFGFHARSVCFGNPIFERCGNEDIDVEREKFVRGNIF